MGSVGDCYDNALCESFFATLECELLNRVSVRTPAEARLAVFDFIEGWYNTQRRHSSLAYESPVNYERQHAPRGARPPVEADEAVDAHNAPTSFLEDALRASSTAPTGTSPHEEVIT